jgi:hypothetical protein
LLEEEEFELALVLATAAVLVPSASSAALTAWRT